MGLGTRIGAGLAATGAAAGGAVAPLANAENGNNQHAPANDVPAIYQNVDYKDPMEQYRNIGEMGKGVEDISGAHADGQKLKGKNDEVGEQNTALQGPGYGEYTDPPQNTTPKQETATSPSESKGESIDSSPGPDDGQDYYNGMGY
jgi:hypothetical protein